MKQQDRWGDWCEVVMSEEVAASYDAITCHIMAFAAFIFAFVEKKGGKSEIKECLKRMDLHCAACADFTGVCDG